MTAGRQWKSSQCQILWKAEATSPDCLQGESTFPCPCPPCISASGSLQDSPCPQCLLCSTVPLGSSLLLSWVWKTWLASDSSQGLQENGGSGFDPHTLCFFYICHLSSTVNHCGMLVFNEQNLFPQDPARKQRKSPLSLNTKCVYFLKLHFLDQVQG